MRRALRRVEQVDELSIRPDSLVASCPRRRARVAEPEHCHDTVLGVEIGERLAPGYSKHSGTCAAIPDVGEAIHRVAARLGRDDFVGIASETVDGDASASRLRPYRTITTDGSLRPPTWADGSVRPPSWAPGPPDLFDTTLGVRCRPGPIDQARFDPWLSDLSSMRCWPVSERATIYYRDGNFRDRAFVALPDPTCGRELPDSIESLDGPSHRWFRRGARVDVRPIVYAGRDGDCNRRGPYAGADPLYEADCPFGEDDLARLDLAPRRY